jgi:hypothetical protein
MVDKKTATRALTGRRQMHSTFTGLRIRYDTGLGLWDAPLTPEWKPITGLFSAWSSEDYFDTSGYNRDYLTTMPSAIFMQEAGRCGITSPGNTRILTLDLVTEQRVTNLADLADDIIGTTGSHIGAQIPSFNQSTDDWSQVLYGRYREFTGLTQGTTVQDVFVPTNDNSFGSLEPTTNDKLWITRIVIVLGLPLGAIDSTLRFPNGRFVMQMDVVKEEELEFMMRQKRSYELSNY